MPISSTANTSAPNWRSMLAPSSPTTAPMKNEVRVTIGIASSPARSASDTQAAQRMRPGLAIVRPTTTSRWPTNAMVSKISAPRLNTPRPVRIASS